jgi:hypothetical protein
MKGVRLYPKWHGYALSSELCLELVDRATERGMAIAIPLRVEDARQRSWLVDVPDVPLDELVALVRARPQARFFFLNGNGYKNSPLGRPTNGLPDNYRMEISRLDVILNDELELLVANLGAERLVFGTGIPFNYPGPALAKLEVQAPTAEVKEMILGRNAARWL